MLFFIFKRKNLKNFFISGKSFENKKVFCENSFKFSARVFNSMYYNKLQVFHLKDF